jgi:hypothetical protein
MPVGFAHFRGPDAPGKQDEGRELVESGALKVPHPTVISVLAPPRSFRFSPHVIPFLPHTVIPANAGIYFQQTGTAFSHIIFNISIDNYNQHRKLFTFHSLLAVPALQSRSFVRKRERIFFERRLENTTDNSGAIVFLIVHKNDAARALDFAQHFLA